VSTAHALGRVMILALILYVIGYINGDKMLTFGTLSFAVAFSALDRTYRTGGKETVK
jgi:uncharacterized PurR-regulated membrane protein YhhQ (DUF165 family)